MVRLSAPGPSLIPGAGNSAPRACSLNWHGGNSTTPGSGYCVLIKAALPLDVVSEDRLVAGINLPAGALVARALRQTALPLPSNLFEVAMIGWPIRERRAIRIGLHMRIRYRSPPAPPRARPRRLPRPPGEPHPRPPGPGCSTSGETRGARTPKLRPGGSPARSNCWVGPSGPTQTYASSLPPSEQHHQLQPGPADTGGTRPTPQTHAKAPHLPTSPPALRRCTMSCRPLHVGLVTPEA